jgi:hypothetical protein
MKNNKNHAKEFLNKIRFTEDKGSHSSLFQKIKKAKVTTIEKGPDPEDRKLLNNLVARLKYKPEVESDYSSETVIMLQRVLKNFGFKIFLNKNFPSVFPQICKRFKKFDY